MSRTALVTGANRGIGFEVCRRLARKGLRVLLTARAAAGRDAARLLQREGLDVRFEPLDVSTHASVLACAERLKRAGVHVDVLVNNAAVYPPGGALDTPPDVFRRVIDVNLLGALWTCQAFIPAMIEAGYGRVVNVSSGSGAFAEGLEGPAAYCVSKAALNALSVKLAEEARGDIKVNAVCPG